MKEKASFSLSAIIEKEHVGMVESYLELKEWLDAFPPVKAWHDYLGRKGHYHLVDAYMYFYDYPVCGYTRAEFDSLRRTLILTGPLDGSLDVEAMVELLIKPISEKILMFEIHEGS